MSIVVVGAGFFGKRIAAAIDGSELARVDVTDAVSVAALLRERRATVVINCAGKTGRPNVDWCETHREETYRSNVVGPCVLAKACSMLAASYTSASSRIGRR